MKGKRDMKVRMIPVDKITTVNSRSRGKSKFRQIVSNISHIGLKKPVTVARREGRDGEVRYDLVCGQGRLEAFIALGQKEIPALVVEVSREKLLLMSLAENLARRQRSSLEMAREILAMKQRGYKVADIAAKVDLDPVYVRGMIRLLEKKEERLLIAVEREQIPLSMAISIAQSNDSEIEQAMADAYERGDLKGKALLRARSIVARRRAGGKTWLVGCPPKRQKITADSLLSVYKKEVARQQVLVTRARECELRLRFVVTAVRKLLADESLVNLLRAEALSSLPRVLADLMNGKEVKRAVG